LTSESRHVRRN